MTTKNNSTPEGVMHGPYPPDEAEQNEAFNQARRLGNEITKAYGEGRIDSSMMIELGNGVRNFALDGMSYGREAEIAEQDDASDEDWDRLHKADDIEGHFQYDIQEVEDGWVAERLVRLEAERDDSDDDDNEDPLAGDVDRWVHPDETRTDRQIAHDEVVANRHHMSGGDGADEYWNDYDEYFGTVNGGEEQRVEVK